MRQQGGWIMRKAVMLKNVLIVLALAAFLTACASAGKHFTIDQANKVTNGMTREEVIAIMGCNPSEVKDQTKTFIWSYAKVGLFNSDSRAVKFSFDEDGKTYGVPEGGAFGNAQKYQD